VQNFETSEKLLEAFKKITLRSERGNPGSLRKDNHNEARTSQNVAVKKGGQDRVKFKGDVVSTVKRSDMCRKSVKMKKKIVRECYLQKNWPPCT